MLLKLPLTEYTTLDGCTALNESNHVVHGLWYFLAKHEVIVHKISLTFPVRGHSFLSTDRVFGWAEKLLEKKPMIIDPEDYYQLYTTIGQIKKLGTDWMLWKV